MARDLLDIAARQVAAQRTLLDMTQQELADVLGWPRSSVSQLELGNRDLRLSELPELCRALRVPLAKLVEGAEARDLRALGLRTG